MTRKQEKRGSSKVSKSTARDPRFHFRLREGLLIVSIALAVFLFTALFTYQPDYDAAGRVGAWWAHGLFYAFGVVAYLFPFALLFSIIRFFRGRQRQANEARDSYLVSLRLIGFVFFNRRGLCATAYSFY